MLAILIFLNAHNSPVSQPILMILVSKFMVHKALSDKAYLLLGLLSPLKWYRLLYNKNNSLYLLDDPRIEHGVTTSKIPFLSLLPRECMSRCFFRIFVSCMQGQYQYRQKCILKICNFLLWRMIWGF